MVLMEVKEAYYAIASYNWKNEKRIFYNIMDGDKNFIKANYRMFELNNPSCRVKIYKIYKIQGKGKDFIFMQNKVKDLCDKLQSGDISPKDLPGII